ncbi:MAG: sulfatase [Thermoanaerobaculia bacterium]
MIRPFQLRRSGATLRWLLAGVLLAGCGTGGEGAGGPLTTGRVVTGAQVLCGMSRDWTPREDGQGWEFRGIAEIPCWVAEAPTGGLTVRLTAAGGTEEHLFEARWDDAPLGPADRRAGAELVLEVPPESLGPGRHLLTLERRYRPEDREQPENRFRRVQAVPRGSGSGGVLAPAEADRLHHLADFLSLGSSGLGTLKMDGWLVDGPGTLDVELPPGPERRLRLRPENASAAAARVSVEVAGQRRHLELPPGEQQAVEVPVPAGAERVRLAVEGLRDGLVLLGAPRLVPPERPTRLPPIVLVTLDTTRRDALGAYGAPPGSTPTLDAFAETATVYDTAVSTTSWTLPSHVSMFTGLYPSRHGAGVSGRRMRDDLPNLARLLRQRGYVPVGLAGGVMMGHHFGAGRDFALYQDPLRGRRTDAARLTDLALELLDGLRGETPFLFVNYFDPHAPYDAPRAFQEQRGVPEARAALEHPAWRRAARGQQRWWNTLVEGEAPLTEAGLTWARAAYAAEVAFMDRELGRLFAGLREHGLWEDALVVVVSDHGELLGEWGYLTHAYRLDPELVEVPLLIKRPGQREGSRSGLLVSVVDLFPELLAAAGVTPPASDGVALTGAAEDRRHVLFEEHVSRIHGLQSDHLRIAKHLWGLQNRGTRQVVWQGGGECAGKGPDGWELRPCSGDPQAVLEALLGILGHPFERGGEVAGELGEEQREMLQALGYL